MLGTQNIHIFDKTLKDLALFALENTEQGLCLVKLQIYVEVTPSGGRALVAE